MVVPQVMVGLWPGSLLIIEKIIYICILSPSMKRILFYIGSVLLAISFSNCHEDDEKLAYASSQTGEVSDITPDGATFNGSLILGTKYTIIKHGFVWGETPILTIFNSEARQIQRQP